MLSTVCTALGAAGISCSTVDTQGVENRFMDHVANFSLSYGTQEEYAFRMEIFAAKDAEYNKINANPDNTFVVGHNMFSTMTEFEAKKMMGRLPNKSQLEEETFDETAVQAAQVDWRKKGAVNPVQNQGQCGSCWAFSSSAAMEGAHFIKTGKLVKLAESQLVDCDTSCNGCNGGLEAYAFQYAQSNPMELETSYPYVAKSRHCKAKAKKGVVRATSHASVKHKSVSALKAAISAGPTCVAVDAANQYFQGYTGGILNNCGGGNNLDHAITAVGYGSENGVDYAIVRNSWTSSWGEEGYIRMALDIQSGEGACGLMLDPTTVKTA